MSPNVDRPISTPRLTRRAVLQASAALAITGTLAARAASEVAAKDTDPEDLTLPVGLSFVGQRIELGPHQYLWLVDGAGAGNVRQTLAPAFLASGWTPARAGLGGEIWSRDHILTAVSQGPLGSGGYAHLVQVQSPPFSLGGPKR